MSIGFSGKLYRSINPVFAREPLSGRGAELYGGRFNPRGMPALYTSLSVVTALREANRVGSLQPTTLVSYDAEIDRVFDSRDDDAMAELDMTAEALADDGWQTAMLHRREAPTQAFGRRLADAGYHGLLVRSFAPGTSRTDLNLVLWRWSGEAPHRLTLIDDEGRLSS